MSYLNQSKNSTTWSDESKSSGSNSYLLKEDEFYLLLETGDKIVLSYGVSGFTDKNKNIASWLNATKNTSSYNNLSKN
jgi:hypothetical protein